VSPTTTRACNGAPRSGALLWPFKSHEVDRRPAIYRFSNSLKGSWKVLSIFALGLACYFGLSLHVASRRALAFDAAVATFYERSTNGAAISHARDRKLPAWRLTARRLTVFWQRSPTSQPRPLLAHPPASVASLIRSTSGTKNYVTLVEKPPTTEPGPLDSECGIPLQFSTRRVWLREYRKPFVSPLLADIGAGAGSMRN